jgi:hypothetical protein
MAIAGAVVSVGYDGEALIDAAVLLDKGQPDRPLFASGLLFLVPPKHGGAKAL